MKARALESQACILANEPYYESFDDRIAKLDLEAVYALRPGSDFSKAL